MRMLQEGQDADIEVTWADQDCINSFSKLNARLAELEEVLETKQTEAEYLVDASTELELEDDDDRVPYRLGDAFVQLAVSDAKERLHAESTRIQLEVGQLKANVVKIESEMDGLKKVLYKKFGSSINLEKPQ